METLKGKKTYLGIIFMAVGETVENINGIPEELGGILKVVGLVMAIVGRYLANK